MCYNSGQIMCSRHGSTSDLLALDRYVRLLVLRNNLVQVEVDWGFLYKLITVFVFFAILVQKKQRTNESKDPLISRLFLAGFMALAWPIYLVFIVPGAFLMSMFQSTPKSDAYPLPRSYGQQDVQRLPPSERANLFGCSDYTPDDDEDLDQSRISKNKQSERIKRAERKPRDHRTVYRPMIQDYFSEYPGSRFKRPERAWQDFVDWFFDDEIKLLEHPELKQVLLRSGYAPGDPKLESVRSVFMEELR